MKRFLTLLCGLALGLSVIATDIDLSKPVPEIRLRDGKTIRHVTVMSFGNSSFTAKWQGGRGIVAYSNLPDDVREQFESKRPPPPEQAEVVQTEVQREADPPAPNLQAPEIAVPPERTTFSRKIVGQVFITTKGGTNYKLGAVRVAVYPATTIDKFKEWSQGPGAARATHFSALGDKYSKAQNHDMALYYFDQALAEMHGLSAYLPTPPAYAMTDADGRFTIEHNVPEPFVVVAYAQRRVGDDTERYVWRVSNSQISPSGELLLHNGNMD
ncbi:MAG TPA: hypothetical protein VG734_19455 [Lacunisphaera sp.]|nr:hypothetical protein [Lacunisphaera sp.]